MKKLESWVFGVFVYCFAVLRTERLSRENVELSIKTSTMITIAFPFFLVFWVTIGLLPPRLEWESIKWPFFAATALVIFGVSSASDRIYDKNVKEIRQQARAIIDNSEQGSWWAARRLLTIYVLHTAVAAVVFAVGRTIDW